MNKKSIISIILLVSFAFVACKKNYTCNCVTTETVLTSQGVNYYYKFNNTSSAYSSKMNQKQARAACQQEQDALTSTYNNWISGNGSYPQNLQKYRISVECELSK